MKNHKSGRYETQFRRNTHNNRNYYFKKGSNAEDSTNSLSSGTISPSDTISTQKHVRQIYRGRNNLNDDYELGILRNEERKCRLSLFRFTKHKELKHWGKASSVRNSFRSEKENKHQSEQKRKQNNRKAYEAHIKQLELQNNKYIQKYQQTKHKILSVQQRRKQLEQRASLERRMYISIIKTIRGQPSESSVLKASVQTCSVQNYSQYGL